MALIRRRAGHRSALAGTIRLAGVTGGAEVAVTAGRAHGDFVLALAGDPITGPRRLEARARRRVADDVLALTNAGDTDVAHGARVLVVARRAVGLELILRARRRVAGADLGHVAGVD